MSSVISILTAFTVIDPGIIGRWETKMPNGKIITGVIKGDNTYEGYSDTVMFAKGAYSFKDSVLTFENDEMSGCGEAKGIYKITFFADTAMRLDVINDDCIERSQGNNGVIYTRSKKQFKSF